MHLSLSLSLSPARCSEDFEERPETAFHSHSVATLSLGVIALIDDSAYKNCDARNLFMTTRRTA